MTQGLMDGWHGDENECRGNCGTCSSCDDRRYNDDDYDRDQDIELNS